MKLSQITILNIPKREREGKYLKKLIEVSAAPFNIPVNISMDRGMGLWDNYSSALTAPNLSEGTHRMIIHDDISFDRNILEKILYVMQFAPSDSIVSFYNPTNGDYTDCAAKGKHVIMTQTNFWLQASIYPNDVAKEFVELSKSMCYDPKYCDDSRLKAYLQHTGKFLYAIVPGLIQHYGAYRSSFGTSGKVGNFKRYSSTVDTQLDVHKVDWRNEFNNTYFAKSTKDYVKEIVNQEFLESYGKN